MWWRVACSAFETAVAFFVFACFSRKPVQTFPDTAYGRSGEKLMLGDRKSQSFKDRLKSFSEEERKKALELPPGPERDAALRKIRQAETAAHLDDWANSPELQPPKR
jgi:hypothetical protein